MVTLEAVWLSGVMENFVQDGRNRVRAPMDFGNGTFGLGRWQPNQGSRTIRRPQGGLGFHKVNMREKTANGIGNKPATSLKIFRRGVKEALI